MNDDRVRAIRELLEVYTRSPSLKHIRDPYSLDRLADDILRRLNPGRSMWAKWHGERDALAKLAVGCWIPASDLREVLNKLPGPALTITDVAERLSAMEDELRTYPSDDLKAGCLSIFEGEKSQGTELAAIARRLRAYIENEERRLQEVREERHRQHRERELQQRRQRLTSGADVGWTQLPGSKTWYRRLNGRCFRLTNLDKKRWRLHRVANLEVVAPSYFIGDYAGRREASAVISTMAYEPEPAFR